MDAPLYICKTCRYSSDLFFLGDKEMIECRRNHPGTSGFPIMEAKAWCWDGLISHTENARIRKMMAEYEGDGV
jgi:hypothetical protein